MFVTFLNVSLEVLFLSSNYIIEIWMNKTANIFPKLASSSYIDAGMMSELIGLKSPKMKFDWLEKGCFVQPKQGTDEQQVWRFNWDKGSERWIFISSLPTVSVSAQKELDIALGLTLHNKFKFMLNSIS